MTITGHGNGSMRRMPWSVDGTATGRARAEAVRAVVLERLDELAREGGLGGREPSEFRVLARADATPLTSGALRDTNRVAIIDYTTDDVAGTRSESTVTFGSGQHRPDPGPTPTSSRSRDRSANASVAAARSGRRSSVTAPAVRRSGWRTTAGH